jgi:MraZ protein
VALFFDCHVHKIDRKGRVSVPALFRAVLMGQSFPGIIAFPSFSLREGYEAIDACGIDRMDLLGDGLDRLDPFSDERDDLAAVIFGAAVQLPFDGDGRIMLPDHLREHAGITDHAAFVGGGRTFQIWSPASYRDFAREAPARARDARAKMRLGPPGGEGRDQ